MKKFLGVLVALTLCVCLLAPVSFAADETNTLTDLLAGIDLGGLTEGDLSSILGDLNIEDFDVEALLDGVENGDADAIAQLETALDGLDEEFEVAETVEEATADAPIDLSFIADLFSGEMDTTAITDMLSGITEGDLSSILGTVSGAFSGTGIDLAGFDLGSFDIASVLGTATSGDADLASTTSNTLATIADTVVGGLESLGLDTTMIEGLLDNEIVNFFANMYIGFIGTVEEETTEAPTTEAPTTTKPAVVTTTTPKTGDTSAVFAAIATLSVASAAAFVCLKKKED